MGTVLRHTLTYGLLWTKALAQRVASSSLSSPSQWLILWELSLLTTLELLDWELLLACDKNWFPS